ncbi:MAG: methyltransferase [Ruminococcaceae bacterium]|nr:methyltransferase [Oscillospiraceae bacterium]
MEQNIRKWIDGQIAVRYKKPMPLLSFPSVSLIGATVKEMISDSALQAKGMKAVADMTDSSASVSFMDLSVEAECFGAEAVFTDNEVPVIRGSIITSEDDANSLSVPRVGSGRTGIYIDAVKKAKELITDRPIFAGIIGPYSLAARLFDVSEIMMCCYDDPDTVHTVLKKATAFLIEYARAYKEIGASGVVMAEPVAGLLSPNLEAEFSSPYVKEIIDAVQDDGFAVIYHNCGDNVPVMLDSIFSTGAFGYHFGNAVNMEKDILPRAPRGVLIMGNIDPAGVLQRGTPKSVREKTLELLEACSAYPEFLLSSGCDIPPLTPWENIKAFFSANKEYYEGKG